MAALFSMRQVEGTVVQDFFQTVHDAEGARKREREACVCLQSAWRGHCVRRDLEILHHAAIDIQRVYRGHLARLLFVELLWQRQRADERAFFDRAATVIQRTFRGYHVRQHVHDFWRRKGFITNAVTQADAMRKEMEEAYTQQKEAEEDKQRQDAKDRVINQARGRHHLVSTKMRPGILQAPSNPSIEMEAFLKETAREVVRQDSGLLATLQGRRIDGSRTSSRELPSRTVLGPPRAPGPFPPAETIQAALNRPIRTTLRMDHIFGSEAEWQRQEWQRSVLLRTGSKDFFTAFSPFKPPPFPPSINRGVLYDPKPKAFTRIHDTPRARARERFIAGRNVNFLFDDYAYAQK